MEAFDRLVEILKRLRQDCPWDRQQTHETLKRYALEEVYELIDAIDSKDSNRIKEELGDVLLQVVFHAQIASERGDFTIEDVINTLCDKLIDRHPHVFGQTCAETALRNWEKNKARESILDGIPKSMPALLRSRKLQDRASSVGFDFEKVDQAIDKIYEEIEELKESIRNNEKYNLEHEIGDILTAAVEVGRLLGIDAELALQKANDRFERRFRFMEDLAKRENKKLEDMTLEEMDKLWNETKKIVG